MIRKILIALDSQSLRQGAVLSIALTLGSFLNFLYHFATGRLLGPADYASLAALIAVLNTVSAPMGLSQMIVADTTARLLAMGGDGQVKHLFRLFTSGFSVAAGLIMLILLLFSTRIDSLMQLGAPFSVIMLAAAVGPAFLLPGLMGGLQGLQDFWGMGITSISQGLVRLLVGVALVGFGFGVSGALGGFAAAGLFAVGLCRLFFVKRLTSTAEPLTIRPKALAWFSVQAALALLAFAAMTSADVVFARRFFPPEQAGTYSAAATLGKVVLFLPGPVAMLMFPKASARHAIGQSRTGMLRKSALATLGLSLGVVGMLTLWPTGIVQVLYGDAYAAAGQWLGFYGVAATGTALVNLFMTYYLAAHDHRFVGLLLGFVTAQMLAFAFLPYTPQAFIVIIVVSSWGVLLAAELWLGGLRGRDLVKPLMSHAA